MSRAGHVGFTVAMALCGVWVYAQSTDEPTNSAPNPYRAVENLLKLPDGRPWGSTSSVAIDKDGKSIWAAERCGQNSCVERGTGKISPLDTVLKFDETGKLLKSFGAGMMAFPHGMFVDADGNVWMTDGQDNAPQAPRGSPNVTPSASRTGPLPGATVGHQVYKFSPDGKLLMTLGKAGGAAEPDYFYQPNAIFVAPNGEIYVSEGHGGGNARILKFTKDGKLIRSFGKKGTGPGEFDQPHALAMDSKGRLYVGDRSNNRIQIFDQDFNYIAEWKQFSRPSGISIDTRTDTIYVADSESGSVNPPHGAWKRGIRIGSIKDGKVVAFIPDNVENATNTSGPEGMAIDPMGNIYAAEVGQKMIVKFVKK